MDSKSLIDAHNKARDNAWFNTPALQKNTKLMEYAQAWAVEMAEDNRLHHSRMSSIMALGFKTVGENIAAGQKDIEDVMSSWMHSFGHKKNIMSKSFTHMGCGYAVSKNGTPYWCVCFGTPSK